MLDRYEHDERISIISGLNYDEKTMDVPFDYFFTTTFSINGWASWRRVIDLWDDERYTFLDDQYAMRLLNTLIRERKYQSDFVCFCQYHRSVRKAYYETIFHAAIFFSSGLSIVPRVNMISNAGATQCTAEPTPLCTDAWHSVTFSHRIAPKSKSFSYLCSRNQKNECKYYKNGKNHTDGRPSYR